MVFLKKAARRCLKLFLYFLALIAAGLLIFGIYKGGRAIRNATLTENERWLEDLATLQRHIEEDHIRPFWVRDEPVWNRRVREVRLKIANASETELDRDHLLVDFLRLAAFPADGHTGFINEYKVFGKLPCYFNWFPEGVFLTRTTKAHADALGARLVRVEDTPIDQVMEQFREITASANESGFRFFSVYYLNKPGVLRGLGIAPDKKKVTFHFESSSGENFSRTLPVLTLGQDTEPYLRYGENKEETLPLYRRHRDKYYWFEYLAPSKTLYVHYRAVANMDQESIVDFAGRLFAFADANPVDKFVLDIRFNTGGNNFLNAPLVTGILERPHLNRRGAFFVITGRYTFSAAICLTGDLETKTRAILVGEPPGDRPNHPGDSPRFVLEHSDVTLGVSSLFWVNTYQHDTRTEITPDIPVQTRFQDYKMGRDPCMDAILSFQPDTLPKAVSDLPDHLLGRYAFSPDKTLRLFKEDGKAGLEVIGKISSDLYPAEMGWATDMQGLALRVSESGSLVLLENGTREIEMVHLGNKEWTPLELVYLARYEDAERAYGSILKQNPDLTAIQANNLAMLGWFLYRSTDDFARVKPFWEINSRLHPDVPIASGVIAMALWEDGKKMAAMPHGLEYVQRTGLIRLLKNIAN